MQIPISYKQSTLDAFIDFYKKDSRDLLLLVADSLNSNNIAVRSDGAVLIASHYSDDFILISSEVRIFVQAAFIEKAITLPEIFDNEMMAALRASFDNESFFSNGAKWGLSGESFFYRINEYLKCTNTKMTTGVSFPDGIEVFDSAEGRKAGMLADCIVTHETIRRLEPYEKVVTEAKVVKNGNIAVDISNAGLKIYRAITSQTYPFVSRWIVLERNSNGVCPCCGGTYKGIFTKSCSKCGMGKGDAEAFAKRFYAEALDLPPDLKVKMFE